MNKNNQLLSVEDLHTFYELRRWGFIRAGNVRAVDGVNLQIKKGEAISVVGESGCGKSTLAKTVLGLVEPTSGKIVFDGKNISHMGREELKWYRAQVGFVQQDPYGALPPFMTVKKILEEPMLINGIKDPRERMRHINEGLTELKMTPVEQFLGKYPHMLSGGQQQRVVIARATILNPKLVVADEPVSMLDASVRVEILELLRELQEEHELAVIYITHDLSTVSYFSERIIVMYGGKIIEEAFVDDLLKNPLHPYTKALLEAISDPDGANVKTYKKVPGGEPPNLLNPPPGCRFHPRCEFMIKGLCEKEEPNDFFPEENHRVECWLYKE